MKNFIKFIFVFFIFLLNIGNSTATPAVPTISGAHCVIESLSHRTEEIAAVNSSADRKYSLLRRNICDCEISAVKPQSNTFGSGDNRCVLFSDNKLLTNYRYYYSTYILRNSRKISPILENAIVTRAP